MKKLSILTVVIVSLLLVGCKSEQKKQTDENPYLIKPEMKLSAEDTIGVRRLCAQFFAYLQNKDIDGAMKMLNYYEKEEIRPLPRTLAAKEATILSMFMGMPKYEIDHIIFYKSDDSEVKYSVTLFEKTDSKDFRPNKASFLLRPIRKGTKWYLTLADKPTDKVKSQIKH